MNQRYVVERFGPGVTERVHWGMNKSLLSRFCKDRNSRERQQEYHVREAYPGENLENVPPAVIVFKLPRL